PAPKPPAQPAQKLSAKEAAAAATRAAAEAAARTRGAIPKSDPIGALVLTGGTR
ncbi:MAG: hypothetical protein JWM77_1928, partial [Rhodospirillales bacterium]|nr:hypothetical protein [Rhodospirillales bacterium]